MPVLMQKIDYHGKFGHILERLQEISIMSRIGICYTACHLESQTLPSILPVLQGIKRCIPYLDSHPHKPIFYPYNSYDGSNVISFK